MTTRANLVIKRCGSSTVERWLRISLLKIHGSTSAVEIPIEINELHDAEFLPYPAYLSAIHGSALH